MSRLFEPPRLAIRLGLDGVILLLFVTSLAFRIIGREAHEYVGVVLCNLFAFHMIWNWGWFKNILTGNYTWRRAILTITALSLVGSMVVLCVCGILNSRHIFGFSRFFDGKSIRQIHTFAAYWGLVLIGFHAGLHRDMILGALGKAFPRRGDNGKISAYLLKPAAAAFIGFAVWASFDRDIGSKLFMGFSFDAWDPGRPLALFYACNLAIIGVYFYIAQLVQKGGRT